MAPESAPIQRQAAHAGAQSPPRVPPTAREPSVVQREDEPLSESNTPTAEGTDVDLDDLARQIYPLVKRLLAVERERRTGRWR